MRDRDNDNLKGMLEFALRIKRRMKDASEEDFMSNDDL